MCEEGRRLFSGLPRSARLPAFSMIGDAEALCCILTPASTGDRRMATASSFSWLTLLWLTSLASNFRKLEARPRRWRFIEVDRRGRAPQLSILRGWFRLLVVLPIHAAGSRSLCAGQRADVLQVDNIAPTLVANILRSPGRHGRSASHSCVAQCALLSKLAALHLFRAQVGRLWTCASADAVPDCA